jgi:hypothetical protein
MSINAQNLTNLRSTVESGVSLPSQNDHGGKFLTTNGSTASWATVESGVSLPSQKDHGGKFLTTNGSTASWATVDASSLSDQSSANSGKFLPDQGSANSGKFLTTNGSEASWATVDTTATSSSTNLITSGAVKNAVDAVVTLPDQSSANSGEFLKTNGSEASWAAVSSPTPSYFLARVGTGNTFGITTSSSMGDRLTFTTVSFNNESLTPDTYTKGDGTTGNDCHYWQPDSAGIYHMNLTLTLDGGSWADTRCLLLKSTNNGSSYFEWSKVHLNEGSGDNFSVRTVNMNMYLNVADSDRYVINVWRVSPSSGSHTINCKDGNGSWFSFWHVMKMA